MRSRLRDIDIEETYGEDGEVAERCEDHSSATAATAADAYAELCAPYPEIVLHDSAPYTIYNSDDMIGLPTQGLTNKVDRELVVPLREDGRAIRRHELGHVRHSPQRLPRDLAFPGLLLGVEDARVNMALAAADTPVELSDEIRNTVDGLVTGELAAGELANVVVRQLASLGTNAAGDVLRVVAEHRPDQLELVTRLSRTVETRLAESARGATDGAAPFECAVRLSAWLGNELGGDSQLGRGLCTHSVCIRAAVDSRRARSPLSLRHAARLFGSGLVRPGKLQVVTAPMVRPYAVGTGSRRYRFRASTEGSVVRYPLRRYLGGAIFQRSARRSGGTVLVDVSGSMRLDAADVDAILAATEQAATVAIYSGSDDRGELRIVAKDGRCAAPQQLEPYGGGNVVDQPALLWLARQARPRIWVSDGGVTGCGDTPSRAISKACERIRRRAEIRRVDNAEAAASVLKHRVP